MPTAATTTSTKAHQIGELCVGGDWACAHGDLSGLRYVALQLAVFANEPMHSTLLELADACSDDPERAAALWAQIKGPLFHQSSS
jgi:hypothetical protein